MTARLLIAGSRRLVDLSGPLEAILTHALQGWGLSRSDVSRVLQGGCVGVDDEGAWWGERHRIPVVTYDPKHYGRPPACYHARNKAMAEDCTHAVLVAWWGPGAPEPAFEAGYGENRGTRSALGFLRVLGRLVRLYAVSPERRVWRYVGEGL